MQYKEISTLNQQGITEVGDLINVLLQLPSNAIVCSNNEPLTSIYYMEIDVANGDTKRVIEKQIHF